MTLVLGIDAGSTVTKAILLDVETGQTWTRGYPIAVTHPHPGRAERDAHEVWSTTRSAIADVLDAHPDPNPRVSCLALTGHGNGAYFVDRGGEPVRPGIMSSDVRATAIVDTWKRQGLVEQLHPMTWNQLWPGQPLAILKWLQEHEPETLREAHSMLMCKDYLVSKLTGVQVSEVTDQSCGGIINSKEGEYSEFALEALGVLESRSLLRPLVHPLDQVGEITREASEATGLSAGTPVFGGAVDNVAIHVGAGISARKEVCVSAGTWSLNQALTDSGSVGQGNPTFAGSRWFDEKSALLIEASPTSAGALGWVINSAFSGPRALANQRAVNVHEMLLEPATNVSDRHDNPMFIPFLDGSAEDPNARAAWLGLSSWNREEHLVAAVIEGICHEHRRHIEVLQEITGRSSEPVRLLGGATRSPAWVQLFADVLGSSILVSEQAEVGALGAALIAATGAGIYPSITDAGAALPIKHHEFFPNPSRSRYREERYRTYATVRGVTAGWSNEQKEDE